ncbi:MAG: hypothetical protein LC437_06775, partial [Thiohalomonas sp.]|nr:hypothetical protein [Thiohalomonas sp.]
MILVPVIPTTLSERTYEQLLTFFDKNGYKKKNIRPFFSMAQSKNKLHHNTINDMEKPHPEFMKSIISFSAEIERMGIHRKPVLAYASRKSKVQSYIPNQLENAGSNTWKLSLIRESNDFPMLG